MRLVYKKLIYLLYTNILGQCNVRGEALILKTLAEPAVTSQTSIFRRFISEDCVVVTLSAPLKNEKVRIYLLNACTGLAESVSWVSARGGGGQPHVSADTFSHFSCHIIRHIELIPMKYISEGCIYADYMQPIY